MNDEDLKFRFAVRDLFHPGRSPAHFRNRPQSSRTTPYRLECSFAPMAHSRRCRCEDHRCAAPPSTAR
jgi:hypothetical protein